MTLNSTNGDDDTIGVILAAMRDDEGVFGPAGASYELTHAIPRSNCNSGHRNKISRDER